MASDGSKVYINYVSMLQDGRIVESNVEPCKFKLGAVKTKLGLHDGIYGMRVGDKRRLTIPPSMCYDDKAAGKIPKYLPNICEVELVKVR